MNKRPDFKSFKEEILKNAKVREEYEALRPEFELMMEFIKARKSAKLSQAALAKKLKRTNMASATLRCQRSQESCISGVLSRSACDCAGGGDGGGKG